MKKIILIILFSVFFSSSSFANQYEHDQKKEFGKALSEMLKNEINPFLIVEISGTEKYIQFYNTNSGLQMDLPQIVLSESEIKKANNYFKKNSIQLIINEAIDPDTREIFTIKSWRKTYSASDSELVLEIAIGALFKIYGINEQSKLKFIRGWQ